MSETITGVENVRGRCWHWRHGTALYLTPGIPAVCCTNPRTATSYNQHYQLKCQVHQATPQRENPVSSALRRPVWMVSACFICNRRVRVKAGILVSIIRLDF